MKTKYKKYFLALLIAVLLWLGFSGVFDLPYWLRLISCGVGGVCLAILADWK